MKVFGTGVSTNPWRPGFFLRGGDICHPLGKGQWFSPPYFTRIWRTFCPLTILPFLCVHVGRFAFYIGFKIYGADAGPYKEWMNPDDVYPGSQALHLSMRTTAIYGSEGIKGD